MRVDRPVGSWAVGQVGIGWIGLLGRLELGGLGTWAGWSWVDWALGQSGIMRWFRNRIDWAIYNALGKWAVG